MTTNNLTEEVSRPQINIHRVLAEFVPPHFFKEQPMTDAKQEALRQALHFHNAGLATVVVGNIQKKPTPQDIVRTAGVFHKFLTATVKR